MNQNFLSKHLFDSINRSIPSEKKTTTISDKDYNSKFLQRDNRCYDNVQQINDLIFAADYSQWKFAISTILKDVKKFEQDKIVKENKFNKKKFLRYHIGNDEKIYHLELNEQQIKVVKYLIKRYKTIHLKIESTSSIDKLRFYRDETIKILHQSRRYKDVGKQKKIIDEIETLLLEKPINSFKSFDDKVDYRFKFVSYYLKLLYICEGRYEKLGYAVFPKTQTNMYVRFFCHFSPNIINDTIKMLRNNRIKYNTITLIIFLLSNRYVYLDSTVLRKRYSRLK